MLRKTLILLARLTLSSTVIFAQGGNDGLGSVKDGAVPGDQTPVFRAETTLVEFTIIALDKDGDPVTDLKKEEIAVKDDGRTRDLALFQYEGGEQPRTVPEQLPGIFTNTPALTPGPPRNITAIVLDTFNTDPGDQVWVKAQTMRYLGALLPNTRVAVYQLGANLAVLHDFTDDPESLLAGIEQAQIRLESPTLGLIDDMAREMETLIQRLQDRYLTSTMIDAIVVAEMRAHESADAMRRRKTLASLKALGDHLAGIPGRKSIVWFGSGITMVARIGGTKYGIPTEHRSYEDVVRDASRRLARQGITMYMFDARGMQVQADISAERKRVEVFGKDLAAVGRTDPYERLKANAAISADTVPAMIKFADITGGRAFWDTNDMPRAMAAIAADSQGTYSLGFYAAGEPDDKWRRLDVRVTRKGVRLQHRDGYLSATAPDAPLDWTEDQWRAAVYNPVGSTAVRLNARLHFDAGAGVKTVTMNTLIVADDLHFRQVDGQSSAAADVVIVDKLPNAQFEMQRDSREILLPEGGARELGVVHVRHTWELTPGASTVRLIVLDRLTGRYGTLDVPVREIPHAQPHPNPSAAAH
jgi:VWFA-related protein